MLFVVFGADCDHVGDISRVFFSGHLAFNKIHGAISGRAMNIFN